jgi:short-subunit dehydrogenase
MPHEDSNAGHERPTAVVTGASRGIGRAIAKRLSRQYDIVAIARHRAALEAVAAEIRAAGSSCTPLTVDLRDGRAVAAALGSVRADVLVNNAGVITKKPFLELTADEWHEMVDINLSACTTRRGLSSRGWSTADRGTSSLSDRSRVEAPLLAERATPRRNTR